MLWLFCVGCLIRFLSFRNPNVSHTAQTNLWVEEDLGSQEALVAHIDGELLFADGIDASVLLDPLGAVCVVLVELFD